jgi:hypothetical protein
VPISFNFFVALIAFIPVVAITDGLLTQDFVALLILANFGLVAATSSAVELTHALKVTRGLKFLTLFPAVWLLFQIIPLPFGNLSNSIWPSAATALHLPLSGHITIDIGNTVIALVEYSLSITLIVATIFVTSERRHAELVLYCLSAIVTFAVVVLSIIALGVLPNVADTLHHSREMLAGTATLGVILNLAAAMRLMERFKNLGRSALWLSFLSMMAFTICLLAIAKITPSNTIIVASFGILAFCLIEVIRRWDLATWSSLSLSITIFLVAGMLIAWRYNSAPPSFLSLQFTEAPPETLAAVQRMLSDSRWTGSGAGSFSALWPIYRQLGGAIAARSPTAAASILITSGAPIFLASVAASISLFVIFFRGALGRRRDSVYSAAAAASVVILFCQSFCDASLETTSVALIGAIIIGLGLAQSVGQGSRAEAVF